MSPALACLDRAAVGRRQLRQRRAVRVCQVHPRFALYALAVGSGAAALARRRLPLLASTATFEHVDADAGSGADPHPIAQCHGRLSVRSDLRGDLDRPAAGRDRKGALG